MGDFVKRIIFIISFYIFTRLTLSLDSDTIPEDVITDLYLRYKEAVADDNNTSSRRVFSKDKQYEIHIQKLKEVNGLKRHNLKIKKVLRTNNESEKFIYIINPLESKVPRAFLTLQEFKNELMNRVNRQRDSKSTNYNATVLKKLLVKSHSMRITKYITTINNTKLSTTKSSQKSINTVNRATIYNYNKSENIVASNSTKNIKKPINVNTTECFDKSNQTTNIEVLEQTEMIKSTKASTNITIKTTETTIPIELADNSRDIKFENTETTSFKIKISTDQQNFNEISTKNDLVETTGIQSIVNYSSVDVTFINNPKRKKTTSDVTPKRKSSSRAIRLKTRGRIEQTTKRRRSTLGRPLVFMGNM